MSPVYVSRGVNVRYFGAFRRRGCRKFKTLVGPSKSREKIVRDTAAMFARNHEYKRAVVAMVADYYDPTAVITMDRQ